MYIIFVTIGIVFFYFTISYFILVFSQVVFGINRELNSILEYYK